VSGLHDRPASFGGACGLGSAVKDCNSSFRFVRMSGNPLRLYPLHFAYPPGVGIVNIRSGLQLLQIRPARSKLAVITIHVDTTIGNTFERST
jgi:hypothetical protein